ncbi:hypothetical protein PMAYCL1PPCAC_11625, partial [Pristionchus mayeri]
IQALGTELKESITPAQAHGILVKIYEDLTNEQLLEVMDREGISDEITPEDFGTIVMGIEQEKGMEALKKSDEAEEI